MWHHSLLTVREPKPHRWTLISSCKPSLSRGGDAAHTLRAMTTMRITKLTHAAVRVAIGDAVLVIDPGVWSEPDELEGAAAVLITHEHADHVDPIRLAALGVPIFAPRGAHIEGLPYTEVAPGSVFTAAGVRVQAVGDRHAKIVDDQPNCPNFGYLVDDRLYHPGDALALPGVPVDTLLLPMAGPWLKVEEAIEFARVVAPERALGIHDAHLSERGLRSINAWLTESAGTDYRYLRVDEDA